MKKQTKIVGTLMENNGCTLMRVDSSREERYYVLKQAHPTKDQLSLIHYADLISAYGIKITPDTPFYAFNRISVISIYGNESQNKDIKDLYNSLIKTFPAPSFYSKEDTKTGGIFIYRKAGTRSKAFYNFIFAFFDNIERRFRNEYLKTLL